MKPSSCPLDILPTSLFKNLIGSIGPCGVTINHSSWISSRVPAYFKHVTVQPLLKKIYLDPSLSQHHSFFSKMPLLARMLEKVVTQRLTGALNTYNIFEKFQSGF